MRKVLLIISLIFLPAFAFTQDIDLERIVVEKIYTPADTIGFEAFSPYDLETLPFSSLEEIIDYSSSVDLRKRSSFGIQQDLSIRGSIFEDNSVSLAGIEINDPQTGHFNLEIPLTSADLEHLDIFKNSQSINFTPKKPEDKGAIIASYWGEHALWEQLLSVNFALKEVKNRISVEHKISSGDRHDTDFEVYNFSSHSLWGQDGRELELLFGSTKRDFGADSFYSAAFRQEEEHIAQQFYLARFGLEEEDFNLNNTAYFRRHSDEFILNRHNPSFYKNNHTTYVYGLKSDLDLKNDFFFSFDIEREKINSTNLSKHHRVRKGGSLGLKEKKINSFVIGFNAGLDYYEEWEYLDNSHFDLGYLINEDLKLQFLFDRIWRAPSFTELYYVSPANIGNPNLDVQRSNNYEIGFECSPEDNINLGASFFYRDQSDTIDWVKNVTVNPWQAQNVEDIEFYGLDSFLQVEFKESFLNRLGISYTYLESDKKNPFNFSKYVFDYNRHKTVTDLEFSLGDISFYLITNFSKPVDRKEYVTCDIKIAKKISDFTFEIEGINIFNKDYEELEDIPGTGRWYKLGVSYSF